MRVALIDYTGDAYGAGLAAGISNCVKELLYFTSKKNIKKEGKYKVIYTFQSGRTNNKVEKICKGIRYVCSYLLVYILALFHRVDVVHVIWAPIVNIDIKIAKLLKSTGVKLVLTPHNVLPHVAGEKYIYKYRELYHIYDKIILHGSAIKKEFTDLYPQMSGKIVIEPHGTYVGLSSEINMEILPMDVCKKIQSAKKVCIYFGNMFYNKGVDYLSDYWLNNYADTDYFLIVVGSIDRGYHEMIELIENLSHAENVYFKPESVSEVELNTLLSLSDIVLLPYRHASMSGVIFKASEMKKTVLCTDTGSIAEYLDSKCSFVASNLHDFTEKLNEIMQNHSRCDLKLMGEKLSRKISLECNWNTIAEDTIKKAY